MTMIAPTPAKQLDVDLYRLNRELDRVKTKVFLDKSAAVLAPIMCMMNFTWVEDIETACTDGLTLWWNPHWFLKLPFETRVTVLVHELWHAALLHSIRRGNRNPEIWNYAADIVINNNLDSEGYSFKGTSPWLDHDYDDMATEDVYDALYTIGMSGLPGPLWGFINPVTGASDEADIVEIVAGSISESQLVNAVVAAQNSGLIGGKACGKGAGEMETVLKQFLQPKINWEVHFYRFFSEKGGMEYNMARPNRRYEDIYMASREESNEGLAHVVYFLDVSGSVSDAQVVRFNSEVRYVKDTFKPDRFTLVLFDDEIQKVYEYGPEDPFDEVVVVGRGGTDLEPVREYIIQHKPTAVVVFSDLYCDPMRPLPAGMDIPMIWVGVNASRKSTVPHGDLIHIRE